MRTDAFITKPLLKRFGCGHWTLRSLKHHEFLLSRCHCKLQLMMQRIKRRIFSSPLNFFCGCQRHLREICASYKQVHLATLLVHCTCSITELIPSQTLENRTLLFSVRLIGQRSSLIVYCIWGHVYPYLTPVGLPSGCVIPSVHWFWSLQSADCNRTSWHLFCIKTVMATVLTSRALLVLCPRRTNVPVRTTTRNTRSACSRLK